MFNAESDELRTVRDNLVHNRSDLGVGVVHLPSRQIHLRSFSLLRQGGGHIELIDQYAWVLEECRGFLIARPRDECVVINLSHVNQQVVGSLHMANETFRDVWQTLRTGWKQLLSQRTTAS
jgi:hypothetical protein